MVIQSHLDKLEAESIEIIREVVAEADNPVLLYSIGKDSSVLLRLVAKAFLPGKIPFPVLHVDTGWKFKDMYSFRSEMQKEYDLNLIVYKNQEGIDCGINPFIHGSAVHTDVMKTQALKKALDLYKFDIAIGGARRDEEIPLGMRLDEPADPFNIGRVEFPPLHDHDACHGCKIEPFSK